MVHDPHITCKLHIHGENHAVFQQTVMRNMGIPHNVAIAANSGVSRNLLTILRRPTTSCIYADAFSEDIIIAYE